MYGRTMIFFALVTFFTSPIHGYSFGAPSCVNQPKHGLDPQDGPIDIQMSKNVAANGEIVIQLGSEDSEATFKGFLVKTKAPGEFVIDPVNPVIEVACTGKFNSDGPDTVAVTHSGPEDKNMVQIVFEQAEGAEQVPEFEVIIVKEYSKYWTDMHI